MWTPEEEEALHTKQYWNILIEAQTAISFMSEAHESYRLLGGDFRLSHPTLTKLFTFWSNPHPLPTLPTHHAHGVYNDRCISLGQP